MTRALMTASVLAVAATTTHASAHALLTAAEPAVGSTVTTVPHEIALDFTEDVEPKFSKIVVQDQTGAEVDSRDTHLASGQSDRLAVGLKLLSPGTYKVIWHVTSTDTHKTQGSFSFTVKP